MPRFSVLRRPTKKPLKSGATLPIGFRSSLSALAEGWSWVISGLALREKLSSRLSVSRDSSRNVGSARNVASRSWLRTAVVWKTMPEFRIRPWSWPWRSLRAPKTSPVLRTSCWTAPCWVSSTRSSLFASSANGARLAIAAERSAPRPALAIASCCIQVWNAALVLASKVRKISSSCTEGCTCALGKVPPSGSFGPSRSPCVSST